MRTRSPLRWLAAVALLLLCSASPAGAQGLAGFLSPGPLARSHADLDTITQCTRCHQAGKGVSAAKCLACHDTVRAEVTSKTGYHADKGSTCLPCHLDHRGRDYAMVRFDEASFDHRETGFPLRGAHTDLGCAACHPPGAWTGLDRACTSCHDDPHGSDSSSRALAEGCTSCHTEETWRARPLPTIVFDHDHPDDAAFGLDGAHGDLDCQACHKAWKFVPIAFDACTSCHKDPHRAPFSNDCTTCHDVVRNWRVPRFDHATTGYRLQGVHRDVACNGCHKKGVVRPIAHQRCADCHKDPHRGQFAPRDCDACHTVNRPGFALEDFDHAAVGWPLEGKHAEATCASCHGEGPEASYVAVPTTCTHCHEDAHAGHFAPDPCDACHSPVGWGVAAFDHDRTAFPLTGAHLPLDCAGCHPPHTWVGVAHASCLDCHRDAPHDATVGADTCADCHTTAAWATVAFDHAARTTFPLAPQHTGAACADCHATERFAGLEPTCEACHVPDRPPSHFAGPCGGCHREAGWLPADLGPQGHAVTGFPLAGAHQRLGCVGCHTPGAPKGAAPADCIGCHATDDVHRNGLGNACADCHTETAWVQTRFRHQLTGWPLRGAHRLAGCDACHAGGYVGTPTDCRDCHLGQAPLGVRAHSSPSFDACDGCHQPYTWATARYPH